LMGVDGVIDNPARRTFLSEILQPDQLRSANILMGAMVNSSRVIGPALAALVIAVAGVTPCFLLNGLSFGAVVLVILAMRRDQLLPRPPRPPGPIRVADTFRYVARVPPLRRALVSMSIVGTFAFEFPVVLPLLASRTFGGDGSTYGVFLAVLSVGAVLGSVAAGAVTDTATRWHELSLAAFAAGLLACALAPSLPIELVALPVMGFCGFGYVTIVSTSVQVNAAPEHRGRVLALWSMAFLGTTMIGAPIIGWIANLYGPGAALIAGAISCVVAALITFADRRRGAEAWWRRAGPNAVTVDTQT
jgi:MFS family permease